MQDLHIKHCHKPATGTQTVYSIPLSSDNIVTVNRPFHIPTIRRSNRISDREAAQKLPPGSETILRPLFTDWTLCYIKNNSYDYGTVKRMLLSFWRSRKPNLELPSYTVQLCGPAIGVPNRPDGLMLSSRDVKQIERLVQCNGIIPKERANDGHHHRVPHDLLRAVSTMGLEYYFYSDQSAW